MFDLVSRVVDGLGLGSGAVLGASFLLVAWYVYRVVGVARLVSSVLGALTRETLVLLVVGAIVLGLGWMDPNVGVVWDHVRTGGAWIDERGLGLVRRLFGWVGDVVS